MKILAIQLKRIGDLILTVPALRALRKKLPDADVSLAIEQGNRDLIPALNMVDRVLVYQRREGNVGLWAKMMFSHYDYCLDFTGNDRSALFSVLSKAPHRVTFQRGSKAASRSFFYNNFVESSVRQKHTIDYYFDLLKPLGVENSEQDISLVLPEWTEKKARQLLDQAQVQQPFVVVQPGTARLEKFWLPERWAEVIHFCREKLGLQCVLTGAGDRTELAHIEKIQQALPSPCPQLAGSLDLLTLGALMRKAKFFMSVDSGPAHLAAAFAVPQIMLFGPTNPFHWRPRHDRAVVILAGQEQPLENFAPHHKAESMRELSTQPVIRAMEELAGSNFTGSRPAVAGN